MSIFDEDDADALGMLGDADDGTTPRRQKRGDGSPLPPFRWWHLVSGRKLFSLTLPRPGGPDVIYAVDVRTHDDGDPRAHLYRDGAQAVVSKLPAAFTVEGGVIQVRAGTYGLRRMHYVTPDRSERRLTPHPRSAIGRRLRLEQTHPVASRWIAAVAIVVLLVGVGVNVPQLVQVISEIPPIAERFGTFVSPIHLPLWLNITLGAGAALASMERGLRLRYHWMLDGLGN
ncbi:hypothetical protein [Microbacterium sp. EST19A]|uniref:hypothetical protein n=1 Tax=Microbacterium sp. EST19A TaxID=2862681 RepID=UPI001CBE6D85|nr:hypothetical protein [Microbacterium sp. EST19A]